MTARSAGKQNGNMETTSRYTVSSIASSRKFSIQTSNDNLIKRAKPFSDFSAGIMKEITNSDADELIRMMIEHFCSGSDLHPLLPVIDT